MQTGDPWAFGWTQLLTLIGFIITIGIAVGGFRTFGRWKRERIEERRIDIAFDVLSIARESKFVFGRIRDPHGFEGEWRNMPVKEGESDTDRSMRGGPYATLVRINANRDYFERMSRLQPKAIAAFGSTAEAAFERFNKAFGLVQEAATFLAWQPVRPERPSEEDFNIRMMLRSDLWAGFGKEDRVEKELNTFRSEVEKFFRPVIERNFRSN
jgi:hypothetical protein